MKLQFSITHKKLLVDVHTLEVTCKTWFNAAHWPDITLHTLRYKVKKKNATLESLSLWVNCQKLPDGF